MQFIEELVFTVTNIKICTVGERIRPYDYIIGRMATFKFRVFGNVSLKG